MLTAVIALRAARVHTGTGESGPATVLADGGTITGVAAHAADAPEEVEDLGDVTVLPGLVDAHLHLCFDASPDVVGPLLRDPDDVLLERMAANARAALAAGVTAARDLGDRRFLSLALRDRLRADPSAGPELQVSGPPLTRTGGHGWFLGGEADTIEQLRAGVRERAERSCDVVKIMVTGGVLTPGFLPHESQFGLEHLRAVVDEAHRLGLPVAAHAHGPDGIRDSVAAGVDSVEHCGWFTADGADVDWGVAGRMAVECTVVGATLGQRPGFVVPPVVAQRQEGYYRTVLALMDLGVRVVCGTDGGVGPAKPHDVLPRAVVELVRRGVAFTDALATATTGSAAACGVDGRKGRIAVGYDADLLVVRGDPEEVERVYRGGVRVR
jgi:imidazolonepropionase-like amidohydrolase